MPTKAQTVTKHRKEWLKALRSGKYKQSRFCLHENERDWTEGHCCLGVAECLMGRKSARRDSYASVRKFLGFDEETENIAINRNDTRGWGFKRIATYFAKRWRLK